MSTDAPIYLDHNATTPLLPEVVDAMLPFLRVHFGNPSSGHAYGAHAREAVARARRPGLTTVCMSRTYGVGLRIINTVGHGETNGA